MLAAPAGAAFATAASPLSVAAQAVPAAPQVACNAGYRHLTDNYGVGYEIQSFGSGNNVETTVNGSCWKNVTGSDPGSYVEENEAGKCLNYNRNTDLVDVATSCNFSSLQQEWSFIYNSSGGYWTIYNLYSGGFMEALSINNGSAVDSIGSGSCNGIGTCAWEGN